MKYTEVTYGALQSAYDHYNHTLFEDRLPQCLITLQRQKGAAGYYALDRFADKAGVNVDEIALNPEGFNREPKAVLSTLVHEMTHLQQAHFGNPPRKGYHNKAWGVLMEATGLIPSATGVEGGKKTGQSMSHYILAGGAFELATEELLAGGFAELLADIWTKVVKPKKAPTRAKFTCPSCGLNAWAKPDSILVCGECKLLLKTEEA